MILNTGQLIADRYEVIEEIGQGGMSIVYRAKDMKLGRDITLKVLREEFIKDEDFLQRFQTEAQAVAALSHPNIVNVYDVGVDGDVNFIVMEFIDGLTLKDLIRQSSPFVDESILGVSVQIAAALQHAHENNIIHRDIKPQNILITREGDVKVTDFGIARMTTSKTIVADSETLGSVQYLSPEQARGDHVDERSDLYSLGIVMFEMATGTLPFDGDNAVSVAYKHVNEEIPSIGSLNPHIDPVIIKVIEKLTRKEAYGRYESANELTRDVKRVLTRLKSDAKKDYQASISNTMSLSGLSEELDEYEEFDEFDEFEEFDKSRKKDKEKMSPEKAEKIAIFAGLGLALFIGLLLAIFLVPKFFGGKQMYLDTPDVLGMTLEEAEEKAKELGIKIKEAEEIYSEEYDEGQIASQKPEAGEKIRKRETLYVAISGGGEEYEVPDLEGLDIDKAYEKMEKLNIPLELTYEYESHDRVEKEKIIRQEPKAGEELKAGSKVRLFVSRGPELEMIKVPGLLGLTEAEAKEKIRAANLQVGDISSAPSDTYRKGTVSAQTVERGRQVVEETVVGITISQGKPEVPKEETQETPKEEEQAKPQASTRTISIDPVLIDPDIESCTVRLTKNTNGENVEVYSGTHKPSDFPFNVSVSGEGMVKFSLFIDGAFRGDEYIDFSK